MNRERILLTQELISEREEDLDIEEKEILDYQQDRFGPAGDLILQRKQLIQPIQDQIFIAIQEIAKSKKYDFIFDKSADIVMLYSDKKYDISDQILRTITRANNREQAKSRKERKILENESTVSNKITSKVSDVKNNNTQTKLAKATELENKNQKRKEELEIKKKNAELEKVRKKAEIETKKQKIIDEKEAKKKQIREEIEARRQKIVEEKKLKIKEIEARKQKIIDEKEAKKKQIREEIETKKKKKSSDNRKDKIDGNKISKDSTFTKILN